MRFTWSLRKTGVQAHHWQWHEHLLKHQERRAETVMVALSSSFLYLGELGHLRLKTYFPSISQLWMNKLNEPASIISMVRQFWDPFPLCRHDCDFHQGCRGQFFGRRAQIYNTHFLLEKSSRKQRSLRLVGCSCSEISALCCSKDEVRATADVTNSHMSPPR